MAGCSNPDRVHNPVDDNERWHVIAAHTGQGEVLLKICEPKTRGQVYSFALTPFEMQDLHRRLTEALWYHVRGL